MSMTHCHSDHTRICRGDYEAIAREESEGRWQVTIRGWDTRDEAEDVLRRLAVREYEASTCQEPDRRWNVTVCCWDTREEAELQADLLLGDVAGRHNAVREGARFGEGNPGPPPAEVL